ncbi:heat-inducible transcriptional repressor HrcA [Ammoniphilus sp. CFH 90114]|uniref:heat-inducible transcriptional repressor HrcA n=1 Tax=Ammoniphilus sp. CFH 90114 TaxID=2493665 RepID=UPI00100DE249|nr:heat-inducible transcriptional repressor HrcA [Ammoniphilus sp. CFH 90114]RXT14810.1 heat-inducible transcriptional repressor HrcA [Ammoniphilus sp. CFH 90114]
MLSTRQIQILHAIVDNYIRHAEPVGSRTISKREDVGYSSATIRNEMADLEELGFLEQPHTSAGRIPSQKGYRFYVDHLVQPSQLTQGDVFNIRQLFAEKYYAFEQITQQTAAILSGLTNYTSIVLGHEVVDARLKHIQIIPLNSDTAVAIIVTNSGKVQNKTINVPDGVPIGEIEKLVNFLNSKLVGIPLHDLRMQIQRELSTELQKLMDNYQTAIKILEDTFMNEELEEKVVLKGTTNIMMQPEFRDVEKVKEILDFLEQNEQLLKHFSPSTPGIQVRIGTENREDAISNCSIISATYHVDGQPVGTIGILGPTRMEYGKVISIVDFLAKDLSLALERFYKGKKT